MISKRIIALGLFAALAVMHADLLFAQATAPDSGKCPWKFPFHFNVKASAVEQEGMYEYDQTNGQYDITIPPGSKPFSTTTSMEVVIDTAFGDVKYSVSGDTLSYFRKLESWFEANGTGGGGSEQLTILFAHGQDSIILFKYQMDSSGVYHGRTSWSYSEELELTNLLFDDSSIFCPDSLLQAHSAFVSETSTSTQDLLYEDENSVNSKDSINLSGIFRPMELFYPALVTPLDDISRILIRSYPNPFSQSTEITFTTDATSYADVSVVNLLGADVAHPFSGTLGAGEHSFMWSTPIGLPDGVYECIVRQDGHMQTLPVVLTR